MSVITRADEVRSDLSITLREIKDKIDLAYKQIDEMIDSDTWGSEQWSTEFTMRMIDFGNELQLIRRRINQLKAKRYIE